ncbi:hypothetical protein H6F32_06215 [Anabaena sp. FACHB-1237]|uniref:hypothetical protein n=1 Tax=Anabaena sp. FACHB-1237 TaxID=2692769 RepID=UPI00168050B4|nr:hypothetical protein [Anabaena sp. FACHB-1237]MBD2137186.1 hypothetical protein [Anabaena sp. FACHB-1237]
MGLIKNLIGSIISFITGLFGKKDGGYYLELKEEAGATPVVTTPVVTTPVVTTPVVTETAPAVVAKAPAPAPAPAKASTPVTPKLNVPKETNFATKYLIWPSSGERRRPGANMNSFLDMAREVKLPAA